MALYVETDLTAFLNFYEGFKNESFKELLYEKLDIESTIMATPRFRSTKSAWHPEPIFRVPFKC